MKLLFLLIHVFFYCECYSESAPTIRTVWGPGEHLEGPHWSPSEKVLYYVDIEKQQVHRLDPSTNNVTTRDIGFGPVTPVVTVKDNPGYVVICARTEVFLVPWDSPNRDSSMKLLTAIDLGLPDNRCNDGKVDSRGRFWLGTMGNEVNEQVVPDLATLYMVTQDNYLNPSVKVRPVSVSNGLVWNSDDKFMFYIDTPTKNVDVFDFDVESGSISNRRTIFSLTKNNLTCLPDGMTMDTGGYLWIACYNGGKVLKVDSRSGKLIEQHNIPASKVTSVMFGGDDHKTLYVTTSRRGLTPEQLAQEPEAGNLFAIEGTGSEGPPENQFVFAGASNY